MWVYVSHNRNLYQNGNWEGDHFAEVDNGMLLIYNVSKSAPNGKLAKVLSCTSDHLDLSIEFENDQGELRTVCLLCPSLRARDLWVYFLSAPPGTGSAVRFESVVFKHPTTSAPEPLQSKRESSSLRKQSITADLASMLGTCQRRLFVLHEDKSCSYFEATPVACVSVSSPTSLLVRAVSPKETCSEKGEMFALTCSSALGEASLPQLPSSNRLSPIRRLSRFFATGSGEPTPNPNTVVGADLTTPSVVTVGTTSKAEVDVWIQDLQMYSAHFTRDFAKDSLDRKHAKVLLKGWCWKRGQYAVVNAWKLRFLLLLSNQELIYSDFELGGKILGSIPLRKMKRVALSKSPDKPQGFQEIIEIDTPGRTWYLSPQALNRSEQAVLLRRWISAIEACAVQQEEHIAQETNTPHRRNGSQLAPPVFSSSRLFVRVPGGGGGGEEDEVDISRVPCVPLVEVTAWERLSGNVPNSMLSPSTWKDAFLLRGSSSVNLLLAAPDVVAAGEEEEF